MSDIVLPTQLLIDGAFFAGEGEAEKVLNPSTGELLVWLLVLAARGTTDGSLLDADHPKKIPALGCLIKEKEDREALGLDR